MANVDRSFNDRFILIFIFRYLEIEFLAESNEGRFPDLGLHP